MISIVCPTIDGREDLLRGCADSYAATTDDYELIVVPNQETCGIAWQMGADKAQGDYIHFTADDIEAHPGWWQAAVETVERGYLPAPRILNTDGSLQSCGDWGVERDTGTQTDFTRVPFLSKAQWGLVGPMIPVHYYSDNAVSWRAVSHGIFTVVHRDYLLTHHLAAHGRGAGMSEGERMAMDVQIFGRYVRGDLEWPT